VHIGRDRLTDSESVLVAQSPLKVAPCWLELPACWLIWNLPAPPALADRGGFLPCLNVYGSLLLSAPGRFALIPREQLLSQKMGTPARLGS